MKLLGAHELFCVLHDAAMDGRAGAAVEAERVAEALCGSRSDAQVLDLAKEACARVGLVEVELVVGEEPHDDDPSNPAHPNHRPVAEQSSRERAADRERGRKYFAALSPEARWAIGDELVLGTLDPIDWFDGRKPSRAFLEGLDDARVEWEAARG